ncbi:helicase-related protein, partial [Granulicoccus phenolivorans]
MSAPAAPVAPPPRFTLDPEQQRAHDFLVTHPYGAVWLGVGTGKTLTTLAALQTLRPQHHILVVSTVSIARSTWLNEIARHGFPIRTRSLIVDDRDRKLSTAQRRERIGQVFTDPPTMYFLNQELLTRPASPRCRVCHGHGGTHPGLPCRHCQTGLVDQLPVVEVRGRDGRPHRTRRWPFPTLIIDEAQGFGSPSSRRFQALQLVRPAISRVIELTGTPGTLHDLWSQVYLLDQGQALGRTITAFRQRWFTPRMVHGTTVPASWDPRPGAAEEIHAAIRHLVFSAPRHQPTLPGGPPRVIDHPVRLPPELQQAYRELRRDLVLDVVDQAATRQAEQAYASWLRTSPEAAAIRAELAGLTGDAHAAASARHRAARIHDFVRTPGRSLVTTVLAQNQAVLTGKLLQFASGTLYTGDPDDPRTTGRYEVLHTAKLDAAETLVRRHAGSPVLIVHHFRADRRELLTRFATIGIHAEAFDGSRAMEHRWNARRIPVMLLHPASGGPGLNLQQGGSTMIWYTLPFSLRNYLQTIGRLARRGQLEPVTIYRLIT